MPSRSVPTAGTVRDSHRCEFLKPADLRILAVTIAQRGEREDHSDALSGLRPGQHEPSGVPRMRRSTVATSAAGIGGLALMVAGVMAPYVVVPPEDDCSFYCFSTTGPSATPSTSSSPTRSSARPFGPPTTSEVALPPVPTVSTTPASAARAMESQPTKASTSTARSSEGDQDDDRPTRCDGTSAKSRHCGHDTDDHGKRDHPRTASPGGPGAHRKDVDGDVTARGRNGR